MVAKKRSLFCGPECLCHGCTNVNIKKQNLPESDEGIAVHLYSSDLETDDNSVYDNDEHVHLEKKLLQMSFILVIMKL